jgi:hypothetical protein
VSAPAHAARAAPPLRDRPRPPGRGTALALALAGAALAAGCGSHAERPPRPTAVVPDRGPLTIPVAIRIQGQDFRTRVSSDFSAVEGGVDAGFQAILGSTALHDVRLQPDGTLTATVPAQLPPGSHDLTVVDPWGRSGTLARAYRVLEPTDGSASVARYRIDAIGPQEAFRPFTASIAAVDASGAVVTDFTGSVRLSDTTGTGVPGTAARFVGGRWSGLVEVRAAHAADVLAVRDDQGGEGASSPFAVHPPGAATIRFSTSAASATAGRCTGPVTVTLEDAFGTPAPAAGDTALTATATPGDGVVLYADGTCATATAAPVVPAGQASATFWFVATRAGPFDLALARGGAAPAVQRETVAAGPPAALAFVTPAQAINAGACSQSAAVEVRDAYGNPSPEAARTLALTATPAGGVTFFAGPACSGAATTITVPAGEARAAFTFSGATAQTVTVTAAASGLASASQDELVTPDGRATRLAFLTPPRGAAAGSCSDELTLQAQDSAGLAVASAGAVQVALTATPSAGFATYSDAACSVPATTLQIGASQSTAGFHFRGTLAASVIVTAASPSLTGVQQTESVGPAPPARVAIASRPQAVAAGTCSRSVDLRVEDAHGNASPVGVPLSVALSGAPSAGLGFYADAACTRAISAVEVPSGASAASFFFAGSQAGAVVVSAAPSGLAGDAQTEEIRGAAAALLAFKSAPQTLTAGACSAVAPLEIRDGFGNPTTAPGGTTISLAAAPAAGFSFFRDAACMVPAPALPVPAGGSGATLFFSGTAPGAVTVTAAAPGLDPAIQTETVTAALPRQLAFATPPQVVAAGACSGPLTVESRDAFGNPSPPPGTAATAVGLSAAPGAGVSLFAGTGCGGAAVSEVSLAPGAASTTFSFRSTAAGSLTLTAATAALGAASQVETVTALPADHAAFDTAPQTVRVGDCSAPVSLRMEDALGNAVVVAAATDVALSADPATGVGFYSDAACASAITRVTFPTGSGLATFRFKGSAPGPVTVTAAPAGMAATSQTETLTETAPVHLVFTTAAQTVTAGACSTAVGLQAVDAGLHPSPLGAATSVALSASPGAGASFFAGSGCSGATVSSVSIAAGGSAATFSFRATGSGSFTLSADAQGMSPSPSQSVSVAPAAPDRLAFTSAPQTVAAGACSAAVALQTTDPFGNVSPVTADTAVALSAPASAGVSFFAGAGCAGMPASSLIVPSNASSATFSFRAMNDGTFTLGAAAAGLAQSAQVETVIASTPDHVVFTSAPQTVAAGACSAAVALETRDASDNVAPVSAPTSVALSASRAGVSFYVGSGCAGAAVSAVSIDTGASATFSFRAASTGALTVTASAAGMSPSPTQDESIVAGAPDHLVFTSAAQTVAAGACSAAVGLQAQDAAGNVSPVSAATAVSLSATPSAGVSLYAGAGCSGAPVSDVSLAAGASAATFSFRATASGTVTLGASAAGMSPAPTQVETVTPGALDHLGWSAIASPQAAGSAFPVTVTARDAWGNVATGFTGTATLTASAGSLTCRSSCTSSTVTGGFLAGVWTGSVAVTPAATGVTLTATSGSATGTSAAFDLSGPASRSPPTARFSVNPTVLVSGNDVAFDAGASSDLQTPTSQLSVSWDFQGTSMTDAGLPPSSPWSVWHAGKTATNAYINNGAAPIMVTPRLAVKDTESGSGGPDVGYARATIVVLPNGNGHCTVDTASDVDDGASSCYAKGTDGKLSFREAVRLANTASWTVAIDFASSMTIAASGTFTLGRPMYIIAPPRVALDGATLSIASSGVVISGLELSRPPSPVVIQTSGDALLRDVYLHDGRGILVKGRARLDGLRASGCSGPCVEVNDAGAYLSMFASELKGSGSGTGLALTSCATAAWNPATLTAAGQGYNGAAVVAATVFSGFATAVDSSCAAAVLTNVTFAANGTGVSGIGAQLLDSIFDRQTTAAVAAATCPGFATSRRHVLWQNASDGCLQAEVALSPGPDTTFSADPRFVYPANGDYRLQLGSPARDLAAGTNVIDLDGPGPARYLGANADRGGRETY